jgi:hypothetical protein
MANENYCKLFIDDKLELEARSGSMQPTNPACCFLSSWSVTPTGGIGNQVGVHYITEENGIHTTTIFPSFYLYTRKICQTSEINIHCFFQSNERDVKQVPALALSRNKQANQSTNRTIMIK